MEVLASVMVAVGGGIFALAFQRWDAFVYFRENIAPLAVWPVVFAIGAWAGNNVPADQNFVTPAALATIAVGLGCLVATGLAQILGKPDRDHRDGDR